jgi:hypothetical protein
MAGRFARYGASEVGPFRQVGPVIARLQINRPSGEVAAMLFVSWLKRIAANLGAI